MARPGVNYHFLLALRTSNKEKDLPRKSGRGKNGVKLMHQTEFYSLKYKPKPIT